MLSENTECAALSIAYKKKSLQGLCTESSHAYTHKHEVVQM